MIVLLLVTSSANQEGTMFRQYLAVSLGLIVGAQAAHSSRAAGGSERRAAANVAVHSTLTDLPRLPEHDLSGISRMNPRGRSYCCLATHDEGCDENVSHAEADSLLVGSDERRRRIPRAPVEMSAGRRASRRDTHDPRQDAPRGEREDAVAALRVEGAKGGIASETPPRPKHIEEAPSWLTPDMVWIEPGTFMMGSPENELGRWSNEKLHEVTLTRGFFIGRTEVTQAQWESVMGSNPSWFVHRDDCPVESVDWFDAVDYCNALSSLEGLTPAYKIVGREVVWEQASTGYRLPTEAEWEYACRAGTSTAFYNGGITYAACFDPNLDEIGWNCGNNGERGQPDYGTKTVGQKAPSAWSIQDMSGNVWEWCWDWWAGYPDGPVTDPLGPDSGRYRTKRGGHWGQYSELCRSAQRGGSRPATESEFRGFRVSRTEP